MAFSFMPTPQQQQQASPFQSQAFQSPFQQTTPQQQQTTQQQQFQQQFQQQQQQQPQMFLFMNDKSPASYSTKWADLHPDSQKILLQIEDRILEYRDESQRLDQCDRLYDSSVSNYGFDQDASHIVQELGGISSSMERQKALLQELMGTAKDMLRNTEVAVRSFMMLRPRFAGSEALTGGQSSFYNGVSKKPSEFLVQTVGRFEKHLGQCRQWIEELEQMLLFGNDHSEKTSSNSLLNSLPKVISNVHAFFIHVASKVESIHQYIESMRSAYLADQRRRGESNDPFLEADRRETARQEAAAKRAHPTLNLPAPAVSTAPAIVSATPATLTTTPAPPQSSAFGTSLFSTPAPSAASMSSPSLFATPNTSSLFGGASATATTPQQSGFGSAPAVSLFGAPSSTPAFGSTTTPAPAASLFSTPFASGASLTSSFGATTKTSKPKTRTSRR